MSLHNSKIAILVVAYNAVNHLIKTISRIPSEIYEQVEEIFVLDDCSSDNTFYAALGYKYEHNVDKLTIIRNLENRGYGGNQKLGYKYAIEKGYEIVILLHGDGQYAPECLADLLKPFENGADLVLGSRMIHPTEALKGGMPLYKFVGNRILTWTQNKLTGLSLSEYHSGYRLYRMSKMKEIPFESFTDTWHFDTQTILAFAERGYKIIEKPIPTFYGDEICHVNGVVYAWHCFMCSLKYNKMKRQGKMMYPGKASISYITEPRQRIVTDKK